MYIITAKWKLYPNGTKELARARKKKGNYQATSLNLELKQLSYFSYSVLIHREHRKSTITNWQKVESVPFISEVFFIHMGFQELSKESEHIRIATPSGVSKLIRKHRTTNSVLTYRYRFLIQIGAMFLERYCQNNDSTIWLTVKGCFYFNSTLGSWSENTYSRNLYY